MVAIQMIASHRAVAIAIGTAITSVRTLDHPGGGVSAKACALLASTSPAKGFDVTEMSRGLDFQRPATEVVQSFNLSREFTSKGSHHPHAGLDEQGWPHTRRCCLDVLTTTKSYSTISPLSSSPEN